MTNIRAVLFDYGLVLTGPADPEAWAAMQALVGKDGQVFHEAYWTPRHAYDRGELDARAYWDAVAAACGTAVDDLRFAKLVELDTTVWTQPNDEMIAWAAALQRANVRTGILSNLGDAMEEGVRARCPWLEEFDHHTFSHRLRMAKPEEAIYEHAARGLEVAPAEVLFIDDRADNIAAARATGMTAVQYNSHKDFLEQMQRLQLGYLLTPVMQQT